ncbi:hypothetical protein [Leptospira sp. GIMC2001]|uniref:hypothetical protein n=1 Tax=Leptospira sp. GIMC2001 TaxID=1513297 RepID=UPI00234A1D88|nr:hypothetical protein [Leptospira sp. GIMC2001]WCL47573.1 hypothetical protein O4O04_00990 [Leptospira sp. GIMC2001]
MLNKFLNDYFIQIVICISLLGILADLNSQDIKLQEIEIEWTAVSYAKEYRVQIRNKNKQNIQDLRTKTNSAKVKLPAGEYEQRVGVVNKFGRLESFSDWQEIQIMVVKAAKIEKIDPKVTPGIVPIKGEKTKIAIQGKNFVPDTEIQFEQNGKVFKPKKIIYKNDNTMEVVFDEPLPQGDWDLVVKNPKKNPIVAKNYISAYEPVSNSQEKKIREKELLKIQSNDNKLANMNSDKESSVDGSEKTDPNKAKTDKEIDGSFSKNRWEPIKRSMLLPGWGHFHMDNNKKGYIYSGLFALSLTNVYLKNLELKAANANYKDTTALSTLIQFSGNNIGSDIRVYRIGADQNAFNKVKGKTLEFNTSIVILLGVYLYQVYDAYADSEDWAADKAGWKFQLNHRYLSDLDNPIRAIDSSTRWMSGTETFYSIQYEQPLQINHY